MLFWGVQASRVFFVEKIIPRFGASGCFDISVCLVVVGEGSFLADISILGFVFKDSIGVISFLEHTPKIC